MILLEPLRFAIRWTVIAVVFCALASFLALTALTEWVMGEGDERSG